ncbi:MAG: hypothetical protein J6C13_04670 [Clostridia bacterium]|nr:hypothetical protein [Clostridia bacterium]
MTERVKFAYKKMKLARSYEQKGEFFKASKLWRDVNKISPLIGNLYFAKNKSYECLIQEYKVNHFVVEHNFVNYGDILSIDYIKENSYEQLKKVQQEIGRHYYIGELECFVRSLEGMREVDEARFDKENRQRELRKARDILIEQYYSINNVAMTFDKYLNCKNDENFDSRKLNFLLDYIKNNSHTLKFRQLSMEKSSLYYELKNIKVIDKVAEKERELSK